MPPQRPSGLSFWEPRGKKTARRLPGGPSSGRRRLRRLPDVGSLKPLGPFRHLELDLVALGQALEALGLDGAVVDEDILSALDLDEAVPLRVVEPLDRALCHTSVPSLLGRG